MAQNTVLIDVVVDDKGTTRKVAVETDKLSQALNRTATGAAQTDRNIKGAAQASSNATKNFAKMSQGMGGLVAAYATIAAQVFALSAAYQFLLQAADLRVLIDGQKALTQVTGTGYASITKSIQSATNAQLGYQQAAQAAAIGTAAGLTADTLQDIAKYSDTISKVLGRDLEDTFNRLVRGITKAEPELLDELGITLRLADATSEYARSIGKTANELTAYERTQGVALFTLKQADDKFGDLVGSTDIASNGIRQLGAAFNAVATDVLPAVSRIFEFFFSSIKDNVAAVIAAFSLLVSSVVRQALPDVEEFTKRAENFTNRLADRTAALIIKQEEFTKAQNATYEASKKSYASLGKFRVEFNKFLGSASQAEINFAKSIQQSITDVDVSKLREVRSAIQQELSQRAMGAGAGTLFTSRSEEALREFDAALGQAELDADTSTKKIGKAWGQMIDRMKQGSTSLGVTFGKTLEKMTGFAVGFVKGLNRLINFVGWVGALYTVFQILKSIFSFVSEKLSSSRPSAEVSLSERLVGTTEEIETAKQRIIDIERAIKGLPKIELKGNFEQILEFTGNLAKNLDISGLKDYTTNLEILSATFTNLQSRITDTARAQAAASDIALTKVAAFAAGPGIAAGAPNIAITNVTNLVSSQTQEINKVDTAIKNLIQTQYDEQRTLLVTAAAYSNVNKRLESAGKLLNEVTQETDDTSEALRRFAQEDVRNAVKQIADFAENTIQAQTSLKSFQQGFETLKKSVIDGAGLTQLEKNFLTVSNLLVDLEDAFVANQKAAGYYNGSLTKLQATGKALNKIYDDLKETLSLQQTVRNAEVEISKLKVLVDNVSNLTEGGIELTLQLQQKEFDLQKAKIQQEIKTLQSNIDLLKVVTGEETGIKRVTEALAETGDRQAIIQAAAAKNAELAITKAHEEGAKAVGAAIKEAHETLIKELKDRFPTTAPASPEVPPLLARPEERFAPRVSGLDLNFEFPQRPFNMLDNLAPAPEQAATSFSTEAQRNNAQNVAEAALEAEEQKQQALLSSLELQQRLSKAAGGLTLELTRQNALISVQQETNNLNNQLLSTRLLDQETLNELVLSSNQTATLEAANREKVKKLELDIIAAKRIAIQESLQLKQISIDQANSALAALAEEENITKEKQKQREIAAQIQQIQSNQELVNAAVKAVEEETKNADTLLQIRRELISLKNPYLQEELSERLAIEESTFRVGKILEVINKLQGQTTEEAQKAIEEQNRLLALESARLHVLKQQANEFFKIGQAARSALGESLQTEIANFLKGGELDVEESFLTILQSVGNAVADQMSQMMTESILSSFGLGEKDEAEVMRSAIVEASIEGSSYYAQAIAGASSRAVPLGQAMTPQGVPSETPTVGFGERVKSLVGDVKEYGQNITETFKDENTPFLNKLGSIFMADAPWIRGLVGGITTALGSLAVSRLGGGGGNVWMNAVVGGLISGASAGFSSWLGGLKGTSSTINTAALSKAASAAPVQYNSSGLNMTLLKNSAMGLAYGGVLKGGFREFASGGVVNKPTLGLVGEGMYNEAVVPLPDGKSIPVIMKQEAPESIPAMIQKGGDRNNIGINVTVNNNGSSQVQAQPEMSNERAIALAQAMQNVVTQELKRQKRPGGLLSPYS